LREAVSAEKEQQRDKEMPRPQLTEQRGGLPPELRGNPNSMAEQVKTAIDEDKIAFLLFGISVVGSICCWSGCLVMPEWIYWGDKIHGLSFEISGPIFSLWAGFVYIRGTGSRDRLVLMTAERLAGAAITLLLSCWYLINLRTLKVRIDVNDLSSEYTEEAYTYYVFGCVLNLVAMGGTLHSIFNRSRLLKQETSDVKALSQEWQARKAAGQTVLDEQPKLGSKANVVRNPPESSSISIDDDLDDDDLLEPASL